MELSADPVDTLYPVSMLIDALKEENQQSRLHSITRLKTIALALGHERTRLELLPFLTDFVTEEDDILCQLAAQLSDFVPLVGGPEHVESILEPLRFMLNVEESKVRDEAVTAIIKISGSCALSQTETVFVPLLKSLLLSSWFVSKISAAGLFACVYPRVSETCQKDLIGLYKGLFAEEVPLVKKAAAGKLADFIKVLSVEVIQTHFIPILERIKDDEQDTLRLLTLEASLCLKDRLFQPTVLGIVRRAIRDDSWRVRHTFTTLLTKLQSFLGPTITRNDLVPAYKLLLQDIEPEVRVVAVSKLYDFCNALSEDVRQETIEGLFPVVEKLVHDGNVHVKSALASVVMKLALILGKQSTIDLLVPVFLAQLRDDVPEVRLNVISNLDSLNKIIGVRLMSESLVPAIVNLSEDAKWRVRLAIVEHMPLLAIQLGEAFFDSTLSNLCLSWLKDNVYGIREAAVNNLLCFTKEFGVEWAVVHVVPSLVRLSGDMNYQFRMTALVSLSILSPLFGTVLTTSLLLPPIINLSHDNVPNVRMNSCRAIVAVCMCLSQGTIQQVVQSCLERLELDTDCDVRYFAQEALEVVSRVN